ncbi:MAG: T9SS type A sorting domain-containing protein, partial [Bacteroides sp.]|nr:T9SS type A sorting domain-containing protein [Bacteroides sp.]
YLTTSSSIKVNTDTTVQIILVANKAKIKFRIYSEDNPLNNVAIELDNRILTSNLTGIALFQELTRFEQFDWTASKEGFSDLSGTVNLVNDTTININLKLSTINEDYESKWLKIYPNPVHSIIFIDSDQIISRVEICDLKTTVLVHKDLKSKNVTFDLTGYPVGVYIARIYRDGLRTLNLKVIKTE